MIREIKIFIRKNYILLIFLLIAIVIIIIYSDISILSLFANNFFNFLIHSSTDADSYKLLSIFNEISIGFIISFIFYFVTQYLFFRKIANNELKKCKNDIDKIYKKLVEFNEFRKFIRKYNEKYIKNNVILSTDHIYETLYLEKNTNKDDKYQNKNFVTNENDYFSDTAKEIKENVDAVLSTYKNLDDDILLCLSRISKNLILHYYTDNIFPEDKYSASLTFTGDKVELDFEDYIVFLNKILGYRVKYAVKYNFIERKLYMENTKLFRFNLPEHLMILNKRYLIKCINENYYLYSNFYIDKDELPLANKNLIGYLKIIDFDISIISEYKNKLLRFAKKIIESAKEYNDKDLNIYYINYLQLKYRLNYGYDSDDNIFLNNLMLLDDISKFYSCVLLRKVDDSKLIYSNLNNNEIEVINNSEIYTIYLKLINSYF